MSGYTSGDTKVTAQLLNNATEETTIHFIASAAKAQNSILVIKPQTIVANGQEQATATFELKDQWDNPVTGKTVQWNSNNNAITISDVRELATNKGVY
ncbi:Ig-like domain-containing protein [Providencia vermicola]|uniref:Ig-like domain-containing protein n=1 Tax=Providencia vermicola TaxID=333965 RepID=UPI001CED4DCC|nr:Ig-like domain-containing protein [Providencia vermicola]